MKGEHNIFSGPNNKMVTYDTIIKQWLMCQLSIGIR